jgi:predicted polyphosphate/ATP-dependent NAD kinase
MKTIGLIINPIAGMGGAVGLKGTDGHETLQKAIELGAVPQSAEKTKKALSELLDSSIDFRLITCPLDMGENIVSEIGIDFELININVSNETVAQNTIDAALALVNKRVDLILFAGGDGTARNICEVVGTKIPVLGIPTGVKMQSSAFAINPQMAGRLCFSFLNNEKIEFREGEVIDLDEEQYKSGNISTRLYGYVKIPYLHEHVQRLKSGTLKSEKYVQDAIAQDMIEKMNEDTIYMVGPGSTTKVLLGQLGLDGSLLGVDIISKSRLIIKDANCHQLLKQLNEDKNIELIIAPIGGQGFLFGRGNQQFTADVLGKLEKGSVNILSSPQKIISLNGQPLFIDTGSEIINKKFSGYYNIISGYHQSIVYRAIG